MDGLTSGAPVLGVRRQDDVIAAARLLLGDALDAGLTTLLDQLVHARPCATAPTRPARR
jgi:hypothetical protein